MLELFRFHKSCKRKLSFFGLAHARFKDLGARFEFKVQGLGVKFPWRKTCKLKAARREKKKSIPQNMGELSFSRKNDEEAKESSLFSVHFWLERVHFGRSISGYMQNYYRPAPAKNIKDPISKMRISTLVMYMMAYVQMYV